MKRCNIPVWTWYKKKNNPLYAASKCSQILPCSKVCQRSSLWHGWLLGHPKPYIHAFRALCREQVEYWPEPWRLAYMVCVYRDIHGVCVQGHTWCVCTGTLSCYNTAQTHIGTLCICVGLARTVYLHRIWPYVWWFPCQKYRIYTVHTYKCMVLANPTHVHV